MTKNICCVFDCDRPVRVKSHQLCSPHYLRYYRTGKVGSAPIRVLNKLMPYKKEKK